MNSATNETTNQRKAMPPPSAPGTKPAHPGEETAYEVSARSGGGGGRGAASKKKQGDGQQGKGKGREARVSAGGKGVLSEEEMMLQDAEADAAEEDDAMTSPPRASKVGKGEGRSMEEQRMHEAMQMTDSGWKSPGTGERPPAQLAHAIRREQALHEEPARVRERGDAGADGGRWHRLYPILGVVGLRHALRRLARVHRRIWWAHYRR